MSNDRAFATFSLGLIALTALAIVAATMFTGLGLAAHPASLVVEHLALGITFRAAYKSLDGSNWILDVLHSTGMVTPKDATSDATPSMGAHTAHAA